MRAIVKWCIPIVLVISLVACGELSLFRTAAPLAAITYANDSDNPGRSFSVENPMVRSAVSASLARQVNLPVSDEIQAVSDHYSSYGDFYKAFTPSRVILPHGGEITLPTDANDYFLLSPDLDHADDPRYFQADFAEPIQSPYVSLPAGTYPSIMIGMHYTHAVIYSQGYDDPIFNFIDTPTYFHEIASLVEVELPGYSGVLTDIVSVIPNPEEYELGTPSGTGSDFSMERSISDEGTALSRGDQIRMIQGEYYNRRNTQGDVFQFSMRELLPFDVTDPDRVPLIENGIVLTSTVDEVQTEWSGRATMGGLFVPHPSLVINPYSGRVILVLNFDVENLIEVYVGADGTPETGDDIIVIADRFWERFTIDVIEVE
jgi:hypothetical protein